MATGPGGFTSTPASSARFWYACSTMHSHAQVFTSLWYHLHPPHTPATAWPLEAVKAGALHPFQHRLRALGSLQQNALSGLYNKSQAFYPACMSCQAGLVLTVFQSFTSALAALHSFAMRAAGCTVHDSTDWQSHSLGPYGIHTGLCRLIQGGQYNHHAPSLQPRR